MTDEVAREWNELENLADDIRLTMYDYALAKTPEERSYIGSKLNGTILEFADKWHRFYKTRAGQDVLRSRS